VPSPPKAGRAFEANGLSAVWTAVYSATDRGQSVREVLLFGDKIIPLNMIPVVYPAEKIAPKNGSNPERMHWNRW